MSKLKTNTQRGNHQFEFLLSHGLHPEMTFLDIGCGPGYDLRCGRLVIEYLHAGNYIGIDRLPVESYELLNHPKLPRFIQNESFDFPNEQIDFAWAQSVFTHIDEDLINLCLRRLRPILVGPFYATFNRGQVDKLGVETDYGYRSVKWKLKTMRRFAESNGYKLDYIGDWGHWHGQKMLRFI